MRTEQIKIRCHTSEKEQIKLKANSLGLNLSNYLRWIGSEGKIIIKDLNVNEIAEFRKLVYEVNKIGTNLNQLAKVCNTSKNIDESDIRLVIDIGKHLEQKLDIYAEKIFD